MEEFEKLLYRDATIDKFLKELSPLEMDALVDYMSLPVSKGFPGSDYWGAVNMFKEKHGDVWYDILCKVQELRLHFQIHFNDLKSIIKKKLEIQVSSPQLEEEGKKGTNEGVIRLLFSALDKEVDFYINKLSLNTQEAQLLRATSNALGEESKELPGILAAVVTLMDERLNSVNLREGRRRHFDQYITYF